MIRIRPSACWTVPPRCSNPPRESTRLERVRSCVSREERLMGDQVVPDAYGDLLARITAEVRTTRLRVARAANSEVLALNWRIGQLILTRQEAEPWGTGVIRRLSTDLRRQFPDMKGLSPSNLQY